MIHVSIMLEWDYNLSEVEPVLLAANFKETDKNPLRGMFFGYLPEEQQMPVQRHPGVRYVVPNSGR
jgi:hypothetical protein